MNKRFFRIVALAVALMLLFATTAFATMTASEYINATSAWIERDGNTVEVDFYIIGTDTMDQIGVKYIYLYEKNGNTWSRVKTYAYTDPLYASTLMASSIHAHAGYVTYSGSASYSVQASRILRHSASSPLAA